MPDQDGKLGLDELLTQAAGGTISTPDPVVADNNTSDTASDDSSDTTSNTTPDVTPDVTKDTKQETKETKETKPATKPTDKQTDKPNPMKEIRDKLNVEKTTREKVEGAVQRYTSGNYDFKLKDFMVEGKVDYDALLTAMNTADTKTKAESKGITPEVQAEIERIDREKIEIEKQKLQISMDKALTNLQIDMGLKNPDINNFFKDAMTVKKNPYQWLAQGGTLQDLYYLIYKDNLMKTQIETAVAAARTKWDEEHNLQKKVPASNPANQTKPATNNTTGISLDDMLKEAANRKR